MTEHSARAASTSAEHKAIEQTPSDDLGFALPEPTNVSKTRVAAFFLIGVAVLGASFLAAYLPKRAAKSALAESTKQGESALVRVETLTPKLVSSTQALTLPGSVQPLEETIVYARANGYVKRWVTDLGDLVKEGDLLAELETPELDQELAQARAQLVQAQAGITLAKANHEFSKTSLERYKQLAPGVASQQDVEQRKAQETVDEASVTVAEANVGAQQANIRRLMQLKSFAKVTAPFGGRVTMRSIERGSLVTAGNATPMFKIAASDPVRVFVQVPQDVAPSVKTGESAKVSVREYAGRFFDGKIARTAGELDPVSRTLNTEIRVPNPIGELLAGMYAEVALSLPTPHRAFEVPATALLNDARGMHLAVVDAQSKVHLVAVTIEKDTGATLQIASGLDGTERVIKIARAELTDGGSVEVLNKP